MKKLLLGAVLLTAGVSFASAQSTKPLKKGKAAKAEGKTEMAIKADTLPKAEAKTDVVVMKKDSAATIKTEVGTEVKVVQPKEKVE